MVGTLIWTRLGIFMAKQAEQALAPKGVVKVCFSGIHGREKGAYTRVVELLGGGVTANIARRWCGALSVAMPYPSFAGGACLALFRLRRLFNQIASPHQNWVA